MPDIDFQRIELNLIPKKGDEPVIFYASQYETARPFIADLKWGITEFAPGDDCTAEIDIRKNDNNLVVITDDVTIDNNEVSVILPVQALTCIGKNLGQVKIYSADDHLIAALNFLLEVQPDPLAGGVDSETAIDNLTTQIESIAEEVIGENYYDKTEVDNLLADKADVSDLPDMTQYYNKTQTDTLLNGKADASTTYTKTEVDNALALKANAADLATVATTGDYDDLLNKPVIPAAQIQSDYAQADNTQVDYIKNKPDIAGMIAAAIFDILPVGTASGNPCSFDTEIAGPLQGLTAEIVASGGYDADTQTAHPIVGHSGLNLDVNGDTFTVSFGQTVYGGVYDANRGKVRITFGGSDLGSLNWSYDSGTPRFVTSDLASVIKKPASASEQPNGLCSCFEITNFNRIYTTADNILAISTAGSISVKCSAYTDADVFATAMAGQMLVYELATPIEIDVSAISVNTIVGTNNITSDGGGDVAVSYKDSIQHYIDNQ